MSVASAQGRRAGPKRGIGRLLALAAAASLAWAAVADNPAVCPDDGDCQGETQHGVPAAPHGCVTAPCHTPVLVSDEIVAAGPPGATVEAVTAAPSALTGIDTPAPPTPPPTALD